MPAGHKSSSRAARADGRDAQNTKIWRKVHSISAGLDSRKYSAIWLYVTRLKTLRSNCRCDLSAQAEPWKIMHSCA